ncbi:Fe-S cluster assembly protein HesB [Microbacterium sp. LRZ72]|uniref:Fe-S cluster assembly protein HesB n=1 Tax=Microbacterium sp. LRZ72 TaxID=2942481 RepID=UPI0029BD75D3|nr:Fe-S cluster assembly protein HesB [Microbacterium sp. LRZ72]MDX2375917.1 Fe-S cluster assembly protein HesB [Microbacterium sp. LRZ72]
MLTLTENAATAVRSIVAQAPDSDNGGLRIRGNGTPEAGYELQIAPEPQPEDAVVETGEARVFLEPAAATELDDKVLDAQVSEDGSVRFALAAQPA